MTKGRPLAIGVQHQPLLRELVRTHPNATMKELAQALAGVGGPRVSVVTLGKALKNAGLQRIPLQTPAQLYVKSSDPARYGYTKAHRRTAQERGKYATSLTDAEWELVADLFEMPEGARGRPTMHDRRSMVDACCYVLRTGCSWRMLPTGDFPPWPAVHKTFQRWAAKGLFEQLHDRLRQQWRVRIERSAQPTTAVIDSQSTRISQQGGAQGYDAGKKVKGRKRHLVVDTLGLLLAVSITAASVQDGIAAPAVVAQACVKTGSLQRLYADSAYAGRCAEAIANNSGLQVHIVRKPPKAGPWNDAQQPLWPSTERFPVLPMRWVVERTHAWNECWRRLVMHHDRSTVNATAWVWLAQVRMLASRLTQVS
jgi:transposase